MAGLKTLSDDVAVAVDVSGVSTSLDTNGAEVGLDTNGAEVGLDTSVAEVGLDTSGDVAKAPTHADPLDPAVVAMRAERDAAFARADTAETDYLVQSDHLAAANAARVKAEGELKAALEALDSANATKASLGAQLAALGAAPPPAPPETKIKRPKVGAVLKLPEEGARAKGAAVVAALEAGGALVMVLADDAGAVQPFAAQVGWQEMFLVHSPDARPTVLFAPNLELTAAMERIALRYVVLLDGHGKVLSSCRLGALLIGGGGLSALIPGNSLRFEFEG